MATVAKLRRGFYGQPALKVARALIGMHLVHEEAGTRRVGRIVETEAYMGPEDRAAHSSRGRTTRTEVMFGPPGYAYVYFIYGFWHCLNVVTAAAGTPHAVLLRAVEPVSGIHERACGPGLLCRAMGIDKRFNGCDLCGCTLWLEQPAVPQRAQIRTSVRIGVGYAGEWARRPWRFYDALSPAVSGPAHLRGAARGGRSRTRTPSV